MDTLNDNIYAVLRTSPAQLAKCLPAWRIIKQTL